MSSTSGDEYSYHSSSKRSRSRRNASDSSPSQRHRHHGSRKHHLRRRHLSDSSQDSDHDRKIHPSKSTAVEKSDEERFNRSVSRRINTPKAEGSFPTRSPDPQKLATIKKLAAPIQQKSDTPGAPAPQATQPPEFVKTFEPPPRFGANALGSLRRFNNAFTLHEASSVKKVTASTSQTTLTKSAPAVEESKYKLVLLHGIDKQNFILHSVADDSMAKSAKVSLVMACRYKNSLSLSLLSLSSLSLSLTHSLFSLSLSLFSLSLSLSLSLLSQVLFLIAVYLQIHYRCWSLLSALLVLLSLGCFLSRRC